MGEMWHPEAKAAAAMEHDKVNNDEQPVKSSVFDIKNPHLPVHNLDDPNERQDYLDKAA